MPAQPIQFYDRYSQSLKLEAVYGDTALRLTYDTLPGRGLAHLFFARPFFSRLFGWHMARPSTRRKIRPFIAAYGIDETEFAQPVEAYASFNAFFHRELKPQVRPVNPHPDSVVFPADARHLGFPELGKEERVFVKGQHWDLRALLGGDEELTERFSGGTLVLSRLCPVDYHHFHYPVAGKLTASRWLDRLLFSVNPIALRRNLEYLWRNRRCLTRIQTDRHGEVCLLEIGATNVGSIRHHPVPEDGTVAKGAPRGWFEFGGSSIITLFEKGRVSLSDDLLDVSRKGIELYAHVGDEMGRLRA